MVCYSNVDARGLSAGAMGSALGPPSCKTRRSDSTRFNNPGRVPYSDCGLDAVRGPNLAQRLVTDRFSALALVGWGASFTIRPHSQYRAVR